MRTRDMKRSQQPPVMDGARWSVLIALVASSPLGGCAGSTVPACSETPVVASDAAPVLRAMVERYATCRSYEDKGTLVLARRSDDGSDRSGSRIAFETAFDRASGGFLFEFTETYERFFRPMQGAIWRRNGGPAQRWWTVKPAIEEKALDDAINSFRGVSLGTAQHVPGMLVGQTGSPFRNLGFRLDGEETIGRVVCVKLSARDSDHAVSLWIGKEDHTLRKLFVRDHFEGRPATDASGELPGLSEEQRRVLAEASREPPHPFTTELTIEYAPVFDRVVEPARFEFTPPPTKPEVQDPPK